METWLCPAPQAADYLRLFSEPDLWARARAKVSAFQVYIQHVLSAEPTPQNPNSYDALCGVRAFERLREWGVPLALEIGAVKPGSCDGRHYLAETMRCIERIEAARGTVGVVAIDEPLSSGLYHCGHQPLDVTAEATAHYIRHLRAFRPGLVVGYVEAWPSSRATVIADFWSALQDARPDFLHLDVDRYAVRDQRVGRHETERDLRELYELASRHGVPFGLLAWGQRAATDVYYRMDTMRWLRPEQHDRERWPVNWAHDRAVVEPDRWIVQSFDMRHGTDRSDVPACLPETDRATLTALVHEFHGEDIS